VVADLVAALAPASAGAELLGEGLQLVFDGAGTITLPGFVADPTKAGWIAENNPIPVERLAAAGPSISPHKLATITALTYEMMASSNAEALARDALSRSIALSLDLVLFGNAAATPAQPAGLRYNIAASTASTATDSLSAMIADIATLGAVVSQVSGNTDFTLIAHPTRALTMDLRFPRELPVTVLSSAAVAQNLLIAVAPTALASATGDIVVDANRQVGSMHMEDQTPQPIVDGGPMASPVMSVFQIDAVALKLTMTA
jgi:Phage capsid family